MLRNPRGRAFLTLFLLCFFFFSFIPMDGFARVGGGRSSGSRGSRSSAPPRQYSAPKQAQPSRPPSQPGPQPFQQPQSSLWRGLLGGMMGGLLGGMLFRGLGFGSDSVGAGSGIGLFEIFLFGALLYGLYRFMKRRRQTAPADSYYEGSAGTVETSYSPGQGYEQRSREENDLEEGLSYIRQMDPSFDEKKFLDSCEDYFFKIQGAWANREMSGARDLLTEEMLRTIQDDAEKLKAERKMNRLDNIAVRSVDIAEAWQESGRDYITVRFYANLLDYTVDELTGQVLSGSKTEPVKFEEYWTFTRAVGKNSWQLSAINQAG